MVYKPTNITGGPHPVEKIAGMRYRYTVYTLRENFT